MRAGHGLEDRDVLDFLLLQELHRGLVVALLGPQIEGILHAHTLRGQHRDPNHTLAEAAPGTLSHQRQ
eukprot:2558135-Rhodomonas_salina.1